MSKPEISVIVPVYNTEKYLARCVESLKKQTFKNIEIILVDDGSGEKCAAMCDEIAKTDNRIIVIHKKNAGAGLARNTGLEAATGEYIGFLDSDDYIEVEMYERLLETAKKNNAALVMSGVAFVGGNVFAKDGDYVVRSYFEKETVFENADGKKQLILGVVGALPHEPYDSRYGVGLSKSLFKRSVITENNIKFLSEREVLSEDTLFMVDFISRCERAVGISGAYYCYCRNDDSVSKAYKSDRLEKVVSFIEILEKRLQAEASESEYKIYLDRLTQGYARFLCSQEIMHAREVKMPFPALKKRLNEICTQKRIAATLKTYPWQKLPIKQAVFAFTMKYRLFGLQKIIVALRDR